MKSIFDLDTPLMRFLTKVGEMIIVNVLFLVCCLPVVTAGASIAALCKISQDIILDEGYGIVRTFFRAFRENFKQATIAWIVILVVMVALGANWMLVFTFLNGTTLRSLLNGLLGVLAVVVISIAVYLFPLLTRYQNTLKDHVMNAMILSVVKLLRTVVMVLMTLAPVLIAWYSLQMFVYTLVFWIVIGFAFVNYMGTQLLLPVFREMEKNNGKDMKILK